jgi:UPF0716 family protein affecting phage T7 exclusion
VAKSLLLAVLALPVMELAAFTAVTVTVAIGVLPALALIAAGSCAGMLILRHAGGNPIARVRVGPRQLQRAGGRQPRQPHLICRISDANSGVYNRPGPASARRAGAPGL